MLYLHRIYTPLGDMLAAGEDRGLTGLWFFGQKHFGRGIPRISDMPAISDASKKMLPVFAETDSWLSLYFSGRKPDFIPALRLKGTPFELAVWKLLLEIPYGETRTYGDLARELAPVLGLPRMSLQAVGGAVGRNPVSLIVPCHRVVGAGGRLTGYAAGLERKAALLDLEGQRRHTDT